MCVCVGDMTIHLPSLLQRTIEVICQDAIAPLEEGMSADQDLDLPLSQEQEEVGDGWKDDDDI